MKKWATLLILLAGILWGCIGLFVRPLNTMGLAAMDIVLIRAFGTCIIFALFLLFYDRKLFRIRLRHLWCFFGTGVCSIVFFNFCYFKAMTITLLSVAAILLYTAPVMVMLMSRIFFKEAFSGQKAVSLILTFTGCVLVTGLIGEQAALSVPGIFIGLGAGFGYALYSIFSRFALERGYNSLTITFYTFLFAAVGSIPFVNAPEVFHIVTKDIGSILFSLAFSLISTVIPYWAYTVGLKYVENGKASILASIEPMVASVMGILFFKEPFTVSGAIGILLVWAGVILCSSKRFLWGKGRKDGTLVR